MGRLNTVVPPKLCTRITLKALTPQYARFISPGAKGWLLTLSVQPFTGRLLSEKDKCHYFLLWPFIIHIAFILLNLTAFVNSL